jgi:hypothetical protein
MIQFPPMESRSTPTFFQIISTDYLAQNLFVMIFGPWVIYVIDTLIEKYSSIFMIGFAALCTPIGLFFFLRRQRAITSTFAHGREVAGRVVNIAKIGRNDSLIEYEYEFDGEIHQASNRVKPTDFARRLRNGKSVNVMVHAQNPAIAFLKDMYLVTI